MKTRLALVLTILSVTAVWAQLPTSTLNISNLRLDSANVARFDVYWKNTSAGQIEYASGQYFFDFNKEVLNGGTGLMTIESSAFTSGFVPRNPTIDNTLGQLKFAGNSVPGAGNGFKLNTGDSIKVMTVRIKTSAPSFLTGSNLSISWRKPSVTPYTNITAYIGTTNTAVTSAITFNPQTLTAIKVKDERPLPKEFAVEQNYPNPFNPSTKIEYQLPFDAKVLVEVYDLTGKKISEVLNREASAGYYSIDFSSSNYGLATGIYIYRLSAKGISNGKSFTATKKMLLLK